MEAACWWSVFNLEPHYLLHSFPHIPHSIPLQFGLKLPPISLSLSLCWMLHNSCLSPDLKACFVLLISPFRSLVIQGLLLEKLRTVRVSRVVCSQNSAVCEAVDILPTQLTQHSNALGRCVCSFATVEWMTSHAASPSTEAGVYTVTTMADVNSRGK